MCSLFPLCCDDVSDEVSLDFFLSFAQSMLNNERLDFGFSDSDLEIFVGVVVADLLPCPSLKIFSEKDNLVKQRNRQLELVTSQLIM